MSCSTSCFCSALWSGFIHVNDLVQGSFVSRTRTSFFGPNQFCLCIHSHSNRKINKTSLGCEYILKYIMPSPKSILWLRIEKVFCLAGNSKIQIILHISNKDIQSTLSLPCFVTSLWHFRLTKILQSSVRSCCDIDDVTRLGVLRPKFPYPIIMFKKQEDKKVQSECDFQQKLASQRSRTVVCLFLLNTRFGWRWAEDKRHEKLQCVDEKGICDTAVVCNHLALRLSPLCACCCLVTDTTKGPWRHTAM